MTRASRTESTVTPPITGDNAAERGTFSEYRKTATTRISDFTVEPGVPYRTPEGLRAEDEPTRIAFDVQGGVYPIRESVFQASYAEARSVPQSEREGLRAAVIEAARKVHDSQQMSGSTLAPGHRGIGGQMMTGWIRAEPFEELLEATYALLRDEQARDD